MYIPLSIPPTPLPQYLRLDRDSQWHISALLSMAVESMTLPSRLRPDQGKRGTLHDMEALLNVNGNQRIASLKCSIMETADNSGISSPAKTDERMPRSNTSDRLHGEDAMQETTARSDVDLSCGEARPTASGYNQPRAIEHVFARVECLRDQNYQTTMTSTDGDENSRKHRRLAGLPINHRFVYCCGLLIAAGSSK